ncbi:hypothetical protein V1478_018665 [Vespula squamosa]|uniref:Uncharacterized protein n=1 Tax=Vespula squamosa TaxID=30214 RepID=A0ABD1ZTE5_VESSQ
MQQCLRNGTLLLPTGYCLRPFRVETCAIRDDVVERERECAEVTFIVSGGERALEQAVGQCAPPPGQPLRPGGTDV